jgi:hypothetical protein
MTSSGSRLFFMRFQLVTRPSEEIDEKERALEGSSLGAHFTCHTGSVCLAVRTVD